MPPRRRRNPWARTQLAPRIYPGTRPPTAAHRPSTEETDKGWVCTCSCGDYRSKAYPAPGTAMAAGSRHIGAMLRPRRTA